MEFPLSEYVKEISGNRKVTLTEALANNSNEAVSHWFYHSTNKDEALYQLLMGRIVPHIGSDGEECGKDYYWTICNFDTGEIGTWSCWASEPSFYVVDDTAAQP